MAARKPRTLPPEERYRAILEAATEVFAAEGYAAARLDEVARRAGIAKGTIYLYFKDKQDLFEQLLQSLTAPVLSGFETLAGRDDMPTREIVHHVLTQVRTAILETRRRHILRLIIAEGPRFPELARFHHDRVVAPAVAALRILLTRAEARGEIAPGTLTRFPQLVVAPMLVALIWDSLFGAYDPLDPAQLFEAHLDVLFGRKAGSP